MYSMQTLLNNNATEGKNVTLKILNEIAIHVCSSQESIATARIPSKGLSVIIGVHQQLLVPLVMLWSSGDW